MECDKDALLQPVIFAAWMQKMTFLPFRLFWSITMKIQHLTPLVIALVAVLSSGSILAADIVGNQTAPSDNDAPYIKVGESEYENPNNPASPHQKGLPGIGVSDFHGGEIIDFKGLASKVPDSDTTDLGNGLIRYLLVEPFPDAPEDHQLGKFDFVKVANADIDVWFGNWTQSATGDGNYQAYYVGDRTNASVPDGGTATYTVVGLSNSNLLSGEFTADFAANTLSGKLTGVIDIKITDAGINSVDGSFYGADVFANNGTVEGITKGHFFGADAASLAGIAEFASDAQLNTAFGGNKKP